MNEEKLRRLLHEYFSDTIDPLACKELLAYLDTVVPEQIDSIIDEVLENQQGKVVFQESQAREIFHKIKSDKRFIAANTAKTVSVFTTFWFKVAAVILVVSSLGLYLMQLKKPVQHLAVLPKSTEKIVPGRNKATLTLEGGQVIVLDKAKVGRLVNLGDVEITKNDSGELYYHQEQGLENRTISYHTLATPKGGEYQLILPDGTKVWLNSASSLTYPVAFTGDSRRVTLTGEAYFEVAKHAARPFYVTVNKMQVKVLGTKFNISAYADDEHSTTTLLEGAVQVSQNRELSVIAPGQKAVILRGADQITVSMADLKKAMAWKNGYFIFDNDDIKQIMKQVSRWYDVDVAYEGVFDQRFGGTFRRSKSIEELLNHLEKISTIHFRIDRGRIIVK